MVVLVVTGGNWGIVVVMMVYLGRLVVFSLRMMVLIWNAVLFVRFIFCRLFLVNLVNLILIFSELLFGVTVVLKISIARHDGS